MSDVALDRAIASVADGAAADWDLLAKNAKTNDERSWLECVRILGEISAFHSSGSASSAAQSAVDAVNGSTVSPPPRMWGRYRLLEQVGQGSFASVHRAWDPDLEREVALKILHQRVVDAVPREKLLREGRALARIRHPRVVQVLSVESNEDELALCMEFVHGQTLEDVLRNNRGPMSAREAALVGGDLCKALAAVHAAGFVHRDVKARNVMRETGGRIVLMDFGSTSDMAPDIALHWGALRTVGTPLYLAPELINGGPASRAGDIYALGVLLFYLVTREFPVPGTSLDALREAHAKNQRRHIRDVRPDLPETFVRAIDAATAPRPDDRPEGPGAMEALLAQVVEGPIHVTHPRARQRSVAVLPFVDASSLGSLQYFCDGMAEELSNVLATVPGLRVIARGSSSHFRAASDDVRQIGAMLNVATVLEGSVRAVGNQLRVVSRLVDTSDGTQVWSERFDRRLDDVFAVQDEIARAVVEALRVHGSRLAPGTPGTRDFEAYALYLKGRHHWNKRTEESLHKSVAYFRSSIDRDPEYAEAHAGLASAEATLGLYGAVAPATVMPDAKISAEHALALNPSLSGALATCGCVAATYEWAWAEAERWYRRAVEMNPSDSDAQHWYAINHLVPLARFDEAALALQRAAEADPLSIPITASAGLLAYLAHRYDEAADGLYRALELDPHAATPRLFLGLTHVETGNYADAIRELETAMQLTRQSPETLAALGYAHARAGHLDRAAEAIAGLTALFESRYVSPSLVAQIHAGLGDSTAALAWLERAFGVRAADLSWLAVRPVFNALRTEPRFRGLLERLDMPAVPGDV